MDVDLFSFMLTQYFRCQDDEVAVSGSVRGARLRDSRLACSVRALSQDERAGACGIADIEVNGNGVGATGDAGPAGDPFLSAVRENAVDDAQNFGWN